MSADADTATTRQSARLFAALGDGTCRDILSEALGEPLTARELAERCDASRSTVYRKLGTLADEGFLARSTRIRPGAKDATQFETAVESVSVEFDEEDGIALDCDLRKN